MNWKLIATPLRCQSSSKGASPCITYRHASWYLRSEGVGPWTVSQYFPTIHSFVQPFELWRLHWSCRFILFKAPVQPIAFELRVSPPIRSLMLNHSPVWVDCSAPCANVTATYESKINSRITQTLVLSYEFPRLCGLTIITLFLSFAVITFRQAC